MYKGTVYHTLTCFFFNIIYIYSLYLCLQIVGPSEQSVFEKNLVSTNVKYQDVLKHHKAYFDDVYERRFTGDVLGYVTPVRIKTKDATLKFKFWLMRSLFF